MFAIAINRATPLQREQVHGIVKQHANGWWHGFADLWIVGGKSAGEWRDLVGVIFPKSPSGVLVLKLDVKSRGTWASRALWTEANKDWLYRNLK